MDIYDELASSSRRPNIVRPTLAAINMDLDIENLSQMAQAEERAFGPLNVDDFNATSVTFKMPGN
jgi:hypothetical protein